MPDNDGRRGSQTTLERGPLSVLEPQNWRPLVNVNSEAPAPRTVRVRVSRSRSESDSLPNIRLPAGLWWRLGSSVRWVGSSASQCNGALRFRFGSSSVSRVLIADLVSGDFQVPSCEHLTLDVVRYTPGNDAAAIAALGLDVPTEVQAEISDGVAPDFSPLLCTAPSSWAGTADESALLAVAPGAYAFELYSDSPLGADNKFEVSPPGALRNFASGVSHPGGPLPVLDNLITVQARGAAPSSARLVYFVR
jgi:hypothetical protein